MSHPGHGPDMNPSGQHPGQPGQPVPPPGQPYQPFDQQPAQPAGAWTPPGASGATPTGEPEKKSNAAKKIVPIVGGVVVLGIAASAFGLFGAGEPEVGDCVKGAMGEDVETVDCGSDEAEAKVVGVEAEEMTYDEFMANDVCLDFASAQSAIWYGPDTEEADGTVYCAEPV